MLRRLALAVVLACAGCVAAPPPAEVSEVAPAPEATPLSIDLRPQFAAFGLEPRGQGARPTCSIFTVASALEFACARLNGAGERFSVEYLNWAANAATGRQDDGDFFHCALAGYARFGICADRYLPYAAQFAADSLPPPDALVDAGRRARAQERLRIRWIRPNEPGGRGLSPEQFDAVLDALAAGLPVAAGAAHSRLLVGYRADPGAPGGGVFLTLDSALAGFGEVSAAFVRDEVCDAFVVEPSAHEAAG